MCSSATTWRWCSFMADEVLVMNDGAIVERGAADAIYADPQNEYSA